MTGSRSSRRAALLSDLAEIVERDNVLADPELKRGFEQDLTGRYSGVSLCVVRPGNTEEVAAILHLCSEAQVGVVPQGGHTGLVGAATPSDDEIVLSLTRLGEIGPVDEAAAQLTVGAGTRLEELQRAVRQRGLDFPVDFAARASATLGGMAATNAGGPLAARYGMMRAQVTGIEAVLPDGRILRHLAGLLKDNTGFDLAGLLVGSEGTLAVITQLRLRLVPRLPMRTVALLGVSGLGPAVDLLKVLRAEAPSLQAVDYFEAEGLAHVCRRLGVPHPFPREHPVYLVVECAAMTDPTAELESVAELADDAAVAIDEAGRSKLWLYRDAHNEAIRSLGIPHKLDVSVPIGALALFERELRSEVRRVAPGAHLFLFGHLGDGNMHVNVVGPPPSEEQVDEAVLNLVARHGGSISAEHGVGRAKTQWLPLSRSAAEIAVMQAVKDALDPLGILSRGRLLP